MQNWDHFFSRFNNSFERTISRASDKSEDDFAQEYACLVEVVKEYANRSRSSGNWTNFYLEAQNEIEGFKKVKKGLIRNGQCWQIVRDLE